MLFRFLVVRLFGTERLLGESCLWLAGVALVLYTLPGVVSFLLQGAMLYGIYLMVLVGVGIIFFVLPGLIIAAIGLSLAGWVLWLIARGYLHITIRFLNWLLSKYWLAQEDIALHDFFSSHQHEAHQPQQMQLHKPFSAPTLPPQERPVPWTQRQFRH